MCIVHSHVCGACGNHFGELLSVACDGLQRGRCPGKQRVGIRYAAECRGCSSGGEGTDDQRRMMHDSDHQRRSGGGGGASGTRGSNSSSGDRHRALSAGALNSSGFGRPSTSSSLSSSSPSNGSQPCYEIFGRKSVAANAALAAATGNLGDNGRGLYREDDDRRRRRRRQAGSGERPTKPSSSSIALRPAVRVPPPRARGASRPRAAESAPKDTLNSHGIFGGDPTLLRGHADPKCSAHASVRAAAAEAAFPMGFAQEADRRGERGDRASVRQQQRQQQRQRYPALAEDRAAPNQRLSPPNPAPAMLARGSSASDCQHVNGTVRIPFLTPRAVPKPPAQMVPFAERPRTSHDCRDSNTRHTFASSAGTSCRSAHSIMSSMTMHFFKKALPKQV